jgi:hypothetical protein
MMARFTSVSGGLMDCPMVKETTQLKKAVLLEVIGITTSTWINSTSLYSAPKTSTQIQTIQIIMQGTKRTQVKI